LLKSAIPSQMTSVSSSGIEVLRAGCTRDAESEERTHEADARLGRLPKVKFVLKGFAGHARLVSACQLVLIIRNETAVVIVDGRHLLAGTEHFQNCATAPRAGHSDCKTSASR